MERKSDPEDLRARGLAYEFLSMAVAPHEGSVWSERVASARAMAEVLAMSFPDGAALGSAAELRDALARLPEDAIEIQTGASVVFGTPAPYPPYEGEYGMAHIFMKLQTISDVAGFYRAWGLEVGPSFRDRPDHLSAELEFMHFLLVKEAHAMVLGSDDLADETRRAERIFIGEHLGTWAPGFFSTIAAASANPFHAAVAAFGREFLGSELTRLGVAPGATEITAPRPEAEARDGCPIDSLRDGDRIRG